MHQVALEDAGIVRRAALIACADPTSSDPDSITGQAAALEGYADRSGWLIAEDQIAGADWLARKRPIWDRLLTAAHEGRFDVLLVWRFEFLAKNLSGLVRLLGRFQALGIDLVAVADRIDTTEPSGIQARALIRVLAGFQSTLEPDHTTRNGTKAGRPRRQVDRDALCELRQKGRSIRQIARALGLSPSKVAAELKLVQGHLGNQDVQQGVQQSHPQ